MSDDSDIRDVMRREGQLRAAGREAERLHTKRRRLIERLLTRGTEKELIAVIKAAGLPVDSPEALEILRIWRENRS